MILHYTRDKFEANRSLFHIPSHNIIFCVAVSPGVSTVATINSEFGNTEMLNCSAMGGPGNRFNWTRQDGSSIGLAAVVNVSVSNEMSGGVYTCTVENSAGSGSAQTTLNGKTS